MEVYEDITIRGVGWSRLAVNVSPLGSPTEGIGFGLHQFCEGFEVFQARFCVFVEGLNGHPFDEGRFFLHPQSFLAVSQALWHRAFPEICVIRGGVELVVGERDWRGEVFHLNYITDWGVGWSILPFRFGISVISQAQCHASQRAL